MKVIHSIRTFHPNLGFTDNLTSELITVSDDKCAIKEINKQINDYLDSHGLDHSDQDDHIGIDPRVQVARPSKDSPYAMLYDREEGEEHWWSVS